MKSIVEKAREIVTHLYERNMVSWNDLDREVVFTIQALNAEVQRMEALAQPEQCQCPNCKVTLHASDCAVHNGPAYPKGKCDCGVQQEPEFFTHSVDQPYDWSEWVCPDPKGYLMKCCDCGLVHEAEFGVVRYKSETEREDCDMVDDPNLQAVFRMRRSEEWSPADMAHRAGGLTMEQPAQQVVDSNEKAGAYMDARLWEFIDMAAAWPKASPDPRTWNHVVVYAPKPAQEPVAWIDEYGNVFPLETKQYSVVGKHWKPLYTSPPAQRTWVGLTDEDMDALRLATGYAAGLERFTVIARAIEAKLKEKNT